MKVRKQLAPRQEIISPPEAATNGVTGPPAFNGDGSRFLGESDTLQTPFCLSRSLSRALRRTTQ